MNNTGNNKNTGYLVVVLLFVGMTAYSNAMKDLAEIQRLTLNASRLIAGWSNTAAPAEIPPPPVKLETCESRKPAAPVDLPWLAGVEETTEPSAAAPVRSQQNERRVQAKPA